MMRVSMASSTWSGPSLCHVMWVMSWLCVLVAMVGGAPSLMVPYDDADDDPGDERWLGDGSFYDLDHAHDHPQADGPGVVELCPPVPKVLPPGGCEVTECSSDRECRAQGLMCCYNGCVYTCLPQVLPAPFFDWLREPRRRRQYGRSWLVPGPDTKSEGDGVNELCHVEICSTTPLDDDSDPLLCPHGYQCVVDDPGNPAKGVPNTGHCAKSSDSTDWDHLYNGLSFPQQFTDAKLMVKEEEEEEEDVQRNCPLSEGRLLLHGHAIVLDDQKCLCQDTILICKDLNEKKKKKEKS